MLSLRGHHIGAGAKAARHPAAPAWLARPGLEGTRGRERGQVPALRVSELLARIAQAFPLEEASGLLPEPGHRLAGRAEEAPPPPGAALGDVGARTPDSRAGPCARSDPAPRAVRRRTRGFPEARGRGGGAPGRRPGPPSPGLGTAPGAAESAGTHEARLGAPTRGVPLAGPPPTASKCAPTLAPVHRHSHGNSYTNGTHVRAHTQFYKHASTRARTNTHTRTLSLTNIPAYAAIASTFTHTQLHTHTHINVQPQTHTHTPQKKKTQKQKHETSPWALNPRAHVHIQSHILPRPPAPQTTTGARAARAGHTLARTRRSPPGTGGGGFGPAPAADSRCSQSQKGASEVIAARTP
ncbi:unnamed protein product [Nyctereutes procyonoides]|uniref:(raccoon dog) hypothetical protein n=1 Tax=Nyctereutes procyonoides TaxID=34880 RepID=A0A811YDK9_NYCPR|nr:unnamed protein product [Nyctereutes procyonoides]